MIQSLAAAQKRITELEAQNRKFFEVAERMGHVCLGCGHVCGQPESDLDILRAAGKRACCPERKMAPLSVVIRALIEKEQADG